MVKVKNEFQFHDGLFVKSEKNVDYDFIIDYLSQEKQTVDEKIRLTKISLVELQKKLNKKGLLTEDFKLNNKLIKDNGLENLPDIVKFKEIKNKYSKLKTQLPIILGSIITSDNSTQGKDVSYYTNKIIIDIDDITLQGKDINELLEISKTDVFCELSFISPGGDGLKLIYEVDLPDETIDESELDSFHKYSYDFISKWISQTYNVTIDEVTINLNRSCFLSKGYLFYYNLDKSVVETYESWKKQKSINNKKVAKVISSTGKSKSSFDYLLNEFIVYFDNNPVDLFTDRNDWVKLSYIIVKFKGDKGETTFQKLSSYSVKYDYNACKKLYKNSLQTINEDRLGEYPERWLYKIMTDNGYIAKTTDRILKNFKWKESDYNVMMKELGFNLIEDQTTGKFYLEKEDKLEELVDSNYNQLITDLRLTYNDNFRESTLKTYIFSKENITLKNFIKERMESFDYDKSDEFDKIFDYIETEESKKLVKNIFLRWGLGAIQNLYDKYYDEILVLKSKQGLGKTTWILNYLTKPFEEWTTTSFNYDIKSKDDMSLLADKMFIYDTENISMKKADNQIIKKITSTAVIDYRRPYDRFPITKKRIASFIMDTNEDIIFNDLTGGRRFLIITLNSMNIYDKDGGMLKKIDYEKVWGYLYSLYLNGTRASDIDVSEIDNTRDNYRLKTDLENIIDDIFIVSNKYKMTFNDIKKHIKEYYENNNIKLSVDDYTDTKIGRILSQKCEKKRITRNNTKLTYYNLEIAKYTNINSFDDEMILELLPTKEDKINHILDNIVKNGGVPSDKEIEILKKLREN